MDTFGDQLKQERERRNVDLDEIARSTKIRVRYLRALEDGQHERLPGIVFAKGYVRAYAETIGADADRLVQAYIDEQRSLGRLETESSHEGVLEALAAAVDDRHDPARRRGKALLAVVAMLIVGVGAWFGYRTLRGGAAGKTDAPVLAERTNVAEPTPPAIETTRAVEPKEAAPAPLTASVGSNPLTLARTEKNTPPKPEVQAQEILEPVEPEVEVKVAVAAPTQTAAQPESEDDTVLAEASLTVPEFGVGTGVQQRVLIGRASEFSRGTPVVFWTRVLGGEPGRTVRHVWSHEGNVVGSVALSIGGAHWRTYSRRTLGADGAWVVEARDEEGRVLARETFDVSASGT